MRRSSAPSQRSKAFVVPLLSANLAKVAQPIAAAAAAVIAVTTLAPPLSPAALPVNRKHGTPQEDDDALPVDEEQDETTHQTPKTLTAGPRGLKRRLPLAPVMARPNGVRPSATAASAAAAPADSEKDGPVKRAYEVFYAKPSTKKHKTFEDGILVLDGITAVLHNMEGKQLGKAPTKFRSMADNTSLAIRGYDMEISREIPIDEFLSGRIFMKESIPAPASSAAIAAQVQQVTVKSFRVPVAGGPAAPTKRTTQATAESSQLRPRHPVDADGAVVLSDGSEFKATGKPTVAVVVDPALALRLRPHQVVGVKFLWKCILGLGGFDGMGAILADDMGLGKTLTTITLCWTALKQGPFGQPLASKAIIVCPSSLVDNWRQEFRKWLGDAKCIPLTVNVKGQEAEQMVHDFIVSAPSVHPVLIISYEMMRKHSERLKDAAVGLLVCDEGHRLKNSEGNKTIHALNAMNTKRRVLLTGTPVQNDLEEFYAMASFVNPSVLGDLAVFRRVFQGPIEKGRDRLASSDLKRIGRERSRQLAAETRKFVLRRTSEVLKAHLPPRVELAVFCNLSPLQKKLYSLMLRSTVVRHCISGGSRASALVLINVLRKLCNDPRLLTASSDPDGDADSGDVKAMLAEVDAFAMLHELPDNTLQHSTKLFVLDALLAKVFAATKDRVVIASNFTSVLDSLEAFATFRNYSYCRLDGATDAAMRQSMVNRFNAADSDTRIFLLSCKAGGVGLNLIGANRLVLFDPDWNPAVDRQTMARVWRDGQSKTVFIYRMLCTGTMEEKIYQRQWLKEEVAGAVVDVQEGTAADVRQFAREDLKDLFVLRQVQLCETMELVAGLAGHHRRWPVDFMSHIPDPCLLHTAKDHGSSISYVFSSSNVDEGDMHLAAAQQQSEEVEDLEESKRSLDAPSDSDDGIEWACGDDHGTPTVDQPEQVVVEDSDEDEAPGSSSSKRLRSGFAAGAAWDADLLDV